jgi:hypothetical protein
VSKANTFLLYPKLVGCTDIGLILSFPPILQENVYFVKRTKQMPIFLMPNTDWFYPMSDPNINPPAQPPLPPQQPSSSFFVKVPNFGGHGYRVTPRFMVLGGSQLPSYREGQSNVATPHTSKGPISVLAVVAFVLAFLVPPAAIVCGHIALHRLKTIPRSGFGFALAATVMGYGFTAVLLIAVGVFVLFTIASSNGDVTYSYHSSSY